MESELMGLANRLSAEQGPNPYRLSGKEEDAC